ncbi:MAG: 16S rRNA (guanine(966)-N(2))-methyltransferase RsmD [Bacteroidetes bacterium CG23_combo_of_CG06-09_8_20_14_all_32_9]|nr:MAG: 16S rRNA (guanine(966)-N(2))-methyltransferase RsmD [Bacteroidetes bacterium CG23_combo_of_CG06-09_8_20_14_all_32_9]
MRIISGNNKGRHIILPKGLTARPTTDFAKEGLFDILANKIEFKNISVLDVFSGTGSISYEFASRGAKSVIAVELNLKQVAFIRDEVKKMRMNIKVMQANAFFYLKKTKLNFDVIFCDPPYNISGIDQIPDIIFDNRLLIPDGWLILEHSTKYNFSEHRKFIECRKYGSVHFSFFR